MFRLFRKTCRRSHALSRILGDVLAVRRGPKGIAKRLVNKMIGRHIVSKLWLK